MVKKVFCIDITYDYENIIDQVSVNPALTFVNDTGLPISDQEYNPADKDKLYFLPGVSVPRVKLKDLSTQHKIKTIRDIEKATHVFASTQTTGKITDTTWRYIVKTSFIERLVEVIKDEGELDDYYVDKLDVALAANTQEYFLMDYQTANLIRNHRNESTGTLSKMDITDEDIRENGLMSSSYVNLIDEDNEEMMQQIADNNIIIYHEKEILKHVNGEDATIINNEVYEQLSSMFESSDEDNVVLAMEILANSNYLASLLYIEMLFKEYAHKMEGSRTKNHVNFKSLLSFLRKNKNYLSTDVDNIITSLKNWDCLTVQSLNILMDKWHDEIIRHGSTNLIKVKTITFDEEILKTVNSNVVYNVVDDYITENEIVEPVELHGGLNELVDGDKEDEIPTEEPSIEEEELELETTSPVTSEEETKNNDDATGNFDWF
jgi:hypothetical protein